MTTSAASAVTDDFRQPFIGHLPGYRAESELDELDHCPQPIGLVPVAAAPHRAVHATEECCPPTPTSAPIVISTRVSTPSADRVQMSP